ncbi:MAG: hypothetical protein V2A63_01285 [Patescibacteria group bacterium]
MRYVGIVFPNSPTAFTFASDAENLEVGDLVAAPLRGKILHGVVVAIGSNEPDFATRKIEKIVRPKVLSAEQIELAHFIREYYSANFGKVLKLFLPARIWSDEPSKRKTKSTEIVAIEQPKKKFNSDATKSFGAD